MNAVEVPSGANTSKLSSSDLDSGINSSSLALHEVPGRSWLKTGVSCMGAV